MKKKLIPVLTAVMTLAMGTTVFAANSPTAENTPVVQENPAQVVAVEKVTAASPEELEKAVEKVTVTVDGQEVTATVTAVSQNAADKAADVVNEQLKDVARLADTINSSELRVAATDAAKKVVPTIKGMVDVHVDVPAGSSITMRFDVAGITASSNVLILHWNTVTEEWEILAGKAGDGFVDVTLTSNSPIAIVELKVEGQAVGTTTSSTTETTAATTTTTTTASKTTSPKTNDAAPVLPVLAGICLAGAVICTKKAGLSK